MSNPAGAHYGDARLRGTCRNQFLCGMVNASGGAIVRQENRVATTGSKVQLT